jgi:hypothetical protein
VSNAVAIPELLYNHSLTIGMAAESLSVIDSTNYMTSNKGILCPKSNDVTKLV